MVNGISDIRHQRFLCYIFNNAYNINVKGYRYMAAAVSFLEVLVYVVGLGMVMSSLDQIQNIFAYAFGFRLGF